MAQVATFLNTHGRRHVVRHPWLTALLLAALATAIGGTFVGDRQIVINTSGSVPQGLYLKVDASVKVGALVDFRIPAGEARSYVRARTGQDPSEWYVLKPVVAGPGDVVDATGHQVLVNGRPVGPAAPPTDAAGQPLPAWREQRVLGLDEWFVYSDRIPNSFDSRCFGPIQNVDISSVRRSLFP